MRFLPATVAASIVGVVACAVPAPAQSVEDGRGVFVSRCAACHGTEGGGGELGPSIVARIPLRADADLAAVIREGLPGAGMPPFGNLSPAESTNLIAFLRTLKPRAGTGPQRMSVTLADGSSLSGVVLNRSAGELQLLGDDRRAYLLRETTAGRYRTVTSQTGWTTYNGQLSGNRYSTLTQITADNVARLAPQWVFTLPNVSQGQVTPVVVDGLMYVSAANDLYALDAGSGRQVWNYRRPRTRGLAGVAARGVNRGVAVSGDHVFMATDHAHLIALNRFSGALLWEAQMADWRQNYNGTGAPMVIGDLVIAGAPEPAQRVLRAIDFQTGKVVWELPQLGNVDSWGGVLATASDLVFFADDSGAFAAADAKSGERLWSFQTSQVWKASPMTYVFDNRQMLAIASGPNILAFALPGAGPRLARRAAVGRWQDVPETH